MRHVRYLISTLLLLLSVLLPVSSSVMAADGGLVQGGFDVALVISNVSDPSVGCRSSSVYWTTNGAATSQVFYDFYPHDNIADYAYSTSEDGALVTDHRLRLRGLLEHKTYHFRVRSAIPGTDYMAISDDHAFTTLFCSHSYQGSTSDIYYLEVNQFGEQQAFRINSLGETLNTIELTYNNGEFVVTIPKGTLCLDEKGNRLEYIEIEICDSMPPLPSGCSLIGQAFSLGPDGTYFDPPIRVTFWYDPNDLTNGAIEGNLVIACCNEKDIEWLFLQTQIDTDTNMITADVSHFTTFAVIGFPISVQSEDEPSDSEQIVSEPELPERLTEETAENSSSIVSPESETSSTSRRTNYVGWVILGPIIGVAIFIAIFIPVKLARKRQAKIQ